MPGEKFGFADHRFTEPELTPRNRPIIAIQTTLAQRAVAGAASGGADAICARRLAARRATRIALHGVTLSLNVLAYVAGGFYGAKSAAESLLVGKIDVDLLMVLAALGAAFIGQWHEGAVLLFLFLAQQYAARLRHRPQPPRDPQALRALSRSRQSQARRS